MVFALLVKHGTDIAFSYINSQLQLEADAREVLPYVRALPSTVHKP